MKPHKAQLLAGYLLAFILVFFPLLEVALAGWPPRPGSVAWRYGTTGLFSRALMTPLLGLVIASAIAVFARHVRTLRTLTVITGVTAVFLFFWSGRFLLDGLHMRAQVGADATARSTLDATTIPAMIKLLIGMVVAGVLAYGNWAAGGDEPESAKERGSKRRADTPPGDEPANPPAGALR